MTLIKRLRGDAGATAVEFALVFTFLVAPVVLFGMQWLLALSAGQQASAAARDAAREAIVNYGDLDDPSSAAFAAVEDAAQAKVWQDLDTVVVACSDASGSAKTCATAVPDVDRVTVDVTVEPIQLFPFYTPSSYTSTSSLVVEYAG